MAKQYLRAIAGWAVVILGVIAASGQASATAVTWNVGSGQSPDNFLTSTGTLDGFAIELGLRAAHRQSLVRPVLTGDVYSVQTGFQGETPDNNNTGAPIAANRARWNFDIHVNFAGTIADLEWLRLDINRTIGSATETSSFNLLDPTLRQNVDCQTPNGGNVCASGFPGSSGTDIDGDNDLSDGGHTVATANPDNFYQGSQNPVFAPWFTPAFSDFTTPFDFDEEATYGFRIVAVDSTGSDFLTRTACVNASDSGSATGGCASFAPVSLVKVPEPSTLLIFAGGLLGLGLIQRRRRRIA